MKMRIAKYASTLALVCMIHSAQAFDGQIPAEKDRAIADIALSVDGDFQGLCVMPDGMPVSGQQVDVVYQGHTIASAKTDEQGRYTVRGLRNGVHVVQHGKSERICRIWDARTAPPAAQKGIVLTQQTPLVRGNNCRESRFSDEQILGAMAFTAVTAVTLATTLNGEDPSSGGHSPSQSLSGVLSLSVNRTPASP